jgi:hypothetical protein
MVEPSLATRLVPFTLGLFEWLARVAVFTAWAPVTTARHTRVAEVGHCGLRRVPNLAALEPFHFGVRMSLLKAAQRRQQICAIRGSERRR